MRRPLTCFVASTYPTARNPALSDDNRWQSRAMRRIAPEGYAPESKEGLL
jgi:hypothetical protein